MSKINSNSTVLRENGSQSKKSRLLSQADESEKKRAAQVIYSILVYIKCTLNIYLKHRY